MICPRMVTNLSTNWAWRSITWLMCATPISAGLTSSINMDTWMAVVSKVLRSLHSNTKVLETINRLTVMVIGCKHRRFPFQSCSISVYWCKSAFVVLDSGVFSSVLSDWLRRASLKWPIVVSHATHNLQWRQLPCYEFVLYGVSSWLNHNWSTTLASLSLAMYNVAAARQHSTSFWSDIYTL